MLGFSTGYIRQRWHGGDSLLPFARVELCKEDPLNVVITVGAAREKPLPPRLATDSPAGKAHRSSPQRVQGCLLSSV